MRIITIAATALFYTVLCSPNMALSQSSPNPFVAELNMKFQPAELKKLERAAVLTGEADKLLEEAQNQYVSLDELEKKQRASQAYESALKKLFESSETYKEAYNLAYEVLKDKGADFWQKMNKVNHRASGMEKARYYESTALKHLNRSLIRRQQALQSDRFEFTLGIMKDALNLEKLAVRDQGRSVQVCADYPVEYNYGWEDDLSLDQIAAIMKDPNVHEPPADIFATLDKSIQVDSSLFRMIIFKVQIAAHTMPLSEDYLNTVYRGDLPIDMVFEEEWYKYSIGRYRTFEEAEATRLECNIRKAFVVAYQEGHKISTQEAIQIMEKTADR
jgi:hypothetical protein